MRFSVTINGGGSSDFDASMDGWMHGWLHHGCALGNLSVHLEPSRQQICTTDLTQQSLGREKKKKLKINK